MAGVVGSDGGAVVGSVSGLVVGVVVGLVNQDLFRVT